MKKRTVAVKAKDGFDRDPVFLLAQGLFLLKISLLVVAFDPFAQDAFALVKSVLSHTTTLVLAGALIWLLLRRGWSSFPWSPIHVGVAAVIVAFILATPFALDQTTALFGTTRRYLGLTQVLDSAVTYAAAFMLFFDARGRSRFLAATVGAALFAVAYAALQRAGLDPIRYEQASTIRPIATIGNADTAGAYLAIVAAIAYVVVIDRWRHLAPPARAGLVVIALVSGFLAVSTETRVAYLVLVAGLAAPVVLLGLRRGLRARREVVLALAVAAALAVALVVVPSTSRERVSALVTDPGATASRLDIYGTALGLIARRPVLGLGPDNFSVAYPSARSQLSALMSPELENSTHDWFMYLGTSAGLLGLAAGVLLLVLVLRVGTGAAPRGSSAAIALVAVGLYVVQGLTNPTDIGLDWILWSSIGLIAGAELERAAPRPLMSVASSTTLGGVLVVALLLAAVPQFGRIEGSEQFNESKVLVQRNRGLEAVAPAREAIQSDARRGVYWSAFGTALAAAGNPSAAEAAFVDAATREPWQPLYWRNIGIMQAQQGKNEQAINALQRAVRADPYDGASHGLLARLLYNRGEFIRAAEEGEQQVTVAPTDVDAYEIPYRAYAQLNRLGDAERLLVHGLEHVNSPHLHVLLARVYDNTGRRPAAINEVTLALAIDPTNAEALELRDQLNAR